MIITSSAKFKRGDNEQARESLLSKHRDLSVTNDSYDIY
jgi:hypothetical protein